MLNFPRIGKGRTTEETIDNILSAFQRLGNEIQFFVEGNIKHENLSLGYIDKYGIDPKYIDPFKNMIVNSSFEVFDENKKASEWEGGIVTDEDCYHGSHSLKLLKNETVLQTTAINPAEYDFYQTRLTLMKRGGRIRVNLIDKSNKDIYLSLKDKNIFPYNRNWDTGRCTLQFNPTKATALVVEITNLDNHPVYLDCVHLHPDFTGKPTLYKDGARSVAASGGKCEWSKNIKIGSEDEVHTQLQAFQKDFFSVHEGDRVESRAKGIHNYRLADVGGLIWVGTEAEYLERQALGMFVDGQMILIKDHYFDLGGYLPVNLTTVTPTNLNQTNAKINAILSMLKELELIEID